MVYSTKKHFFLLLLLPGIAQGYVYEETMLEKWRKELNGMQEIECCKDFHDKHHEVNNEQREIVKNAVGRYDLVIVEDLSSVNDEGSKACGTFMINSRGGILGGLADYCSAQNIPIENVEYRYCRVVSLAPILKHLKGDLEALPSVKKTKIGCIKKEVLKAIEEVKNYNDGRILNKYYAQEIKRIEKELNSFGIEGKEDMPVAHYIDAVTTIEDRPSFIKNLLTFDSTLLDIKILHTIAQAKNKKKILIVAGGSHIKRVIKVLLKIGYKITNEISTEKKEEHNLKRCFGANIVDGEFCIKPEPLDKTDFLNPDSKHKTTTVKNK